MNDLRPSRFLLMPASAARRRPFCLALCVLAVTAFSGVALAEEAFVTIHAVNGNRMQISRSAAGRGTPQPQLQPGSPGTGAGGSGRSFGRGRRRFGGQTVPSGAGSPNEQSGQMNNGRGQSPGQSSGRGRGRFSQGAASTAKTTVSVPATAKITVAMRERRTFEFRVMGELAGGLRHPVFTQMKAPLQARLVTNGNRITEVNVITGDTDINQSATSSSGENIVAVKPKRPPRKRSR